MIAIVPLLERPAPVASDAARSLRGVNAAVVGVLIAPLIRPVWATAVHSLVDVALAVAGLLLLVR